MPPRFIAFFGPDGTGKSTQVKLLVNHFQSHKNKVRKVWIRSPHTLAYLLSRFFVRIGFYRVVLNPFGRKMKLPAVHLDRRIRLFWSIIELLGVMPAILFRVYVPLFLGYTVVAERYVIDTIVTVAYYTNDLGFLQSQTTKLLLRFVPKNTLLIHLDSNYRTIMKRRGNFVESCDFINFQRKGYRIIGNSVEATYIDTSNISVEETYKRIMQWLSINQVFQSENKLF